MLDRPSPSDYIPFQATYIRLVPEGDLIALLAEQAEAVRSLLGSLTEEQANYRYAPDKWSLKQVIGHISDNERIMSYRLLRFARGDQTELPGYEQDVLVPNAPFEDWTLTALAEDYSAVRQSTLTLLRGLRPDDWLRRGRANGGEMSVLALAAINSGHELHHLNIIRERYLR